MATVVHCVMCFEALSASLEKRKPFTLSQVRTSFSKYLSAISDDETPSSATSTQDLPLKNPLLDRVSASGVSTPSSDSSSSLSASASTPGTTPASSTSSIPIEESPLFVTWNTVEDGLPHSHSLRGCIGTFEALPLSEGVSSYALTSALDDYRFSPITIAEIPTLSVSVTLLTDFETADDPMDWELGVHGIRISFYAKGRRYGACYLPDVATEQGWTKEETIVSLMRKGGWTGRKDKWRDVGEIKVVRFRGEVATCGYDTFKEWRDWVVKQG